MAGSLRAKTISGVLWSAAERFSLQGIQFIINIIMARLLMPSDYGMIGMLAIFIQISQLFIDGGFTNALIQRKDRTEIDFSTVFYFNVFISLFFYFLIFISAPWIAEFYRMPELILVTRVITLNFILSSLSAIHRIKLTINIDFKTQSKVSLISAVSSGILGICMAYSGFGVWALVFQSLLNNLLLTILFYFFYRWRPLLSFSMSSFKRLFSFGSKLLMSSLIHSVYYNLYSIVIGRRFSAIDLGYYTRAEQFAIFPSANVNAVISRVTFPILSSIQDDNERLTQAYRKYIRLASYLIFPLMVGLAVLAKPLIILLLTEKWIGIVILLQILCFDWMFDHLSGINLNLLYVKGRSDLALRLELIKKTIATIILFSSIPFGLIGMCLGRVLYSLIATYLNTYYTKDLIGLSFLKQVKDIVPFFLLSLLMGAVCAFTISFIESYILKILVGFFVGAIVYVSLSILFRFESIRDIIGMLK